MATKEVTIYILDVGATMKAKREQSKDLTRLDEMKAVLTKLVAGKVHMGRKTVFVSVILFGSDETDNPLQGDGPEPEYQFVKVLQPIAMASLDLMKGIQSDVKLGEVMGDPMDALIVATEMMNVYCKKLKYEKKIFLLTDACSPINQVGSEAVVASLQENNIELRIVGTDFDNDGTGVREPKSTTQAENEEFFRGLATATNGEVYTLDEAVEATAEFSAKKVKPTAVFRGRLDIGDTENHGDTAVGIPIHMFARTMVATLPTAKKYSTLSEVMQSDQATGLVNMSRTYKLKGVDDPDSATVQADEIEKAYAYGKGLVPFRKIDTETFKLRTQKSMSLLAFFPSDKFKPEWLMSTVYSIFSEPNNAKAKLELLSLVQAMVEEQVFALCRYVRVDDAEPKLGILWPEFSTEFKCLYYAPVAFDEDIRHFMFSSLDKVKTASGKVLEQHKFRPTEEMYVATREFVQAMDLMNRGPDGTEYKPLESVYNPAIHRHKQVVEFRALNPDSPLPPVPHELAEQFVAPQAMVQEALPFSTNLIRLFDLKKTETQTKGKRGYGGVKGTGEEVENLMDSLGGKKSRGDAFGTLSATGGDGEGSDVQSSFSSSQIPGGMRTLHSDFIAGGGVKSVGSTTPASDFETLIQKSQMSTGGAGWVSAPDACEQIKSMMKQLLESSAGASQYAKVLLCLTSLRQVSCQDLKGPQSSSDGEHQAREKLARKRQEWVDRIQGWNVFLKELKQLCKSPAATGGYGREDFWDEYVQQNTTRATIGFGLITDREVDRILPDDIDIDTSEKLREPGVAEGENEDFLYGTGEQGPGAVEEQADTDMIDEEDLFANMD